MKWWCRFLAHCKLLRRLTPYIIPAISAWLDNVLNTVIILTPKCVRLTIRPVCVVDGSFPLLALPYPFDQIERDMQAWLIIALYMYNYTIVARCDGIHGIFYNRGGQMAAEAKPRVPFATNNLLMVTLLFLFLKFWWHLQTLLRWSMHCLKKQTNSSNKTNFSTVPSNPQVFHTQLWKTTNVGTIKVMYTGVLHISCYPSHFTCIFVLYHVIGSRPK